MSRAGRDPGGQRVVLVHRYFWPDTPPYAAMLASIAGELDRAGHHVTVLTCRPSYRRETHPDSAGPGVGGGVSVVRWRVFPDRRSRVLKMVNLALFGGHLLTARRHWRGADVIMAATTPPVLVALACSLVARAVGARFVYHRQDIYPEVLGNPGSALRSAASAVLRRVDAATDARAWRSVVLSRDMARTVQRRCGGRAHTVVLNNFDPWRIDDREPRPPRPPGGRLVVVLAGNLGRFQGIDLVVDLVARTAHDRRIQWHVYGDGPSTGHLERAARAHGTVVLHGYRPPRDVAHVLRSEAHLGLVSLNPGVIRTAYPSRTMTYLRHGCPLLAIVEPDSELATMIRDEGLGITGGPDEIGLLADRLIAVADRPEDLTAMRARARAAYGGRFAAEHALPRWLDLVAGVPGRLEQP